MIEAQVDINPIMFRQFAVRCQSLKLDPGKLLEKYLVSGVVDFLKVEKQLDSSEEEAGIDNIPGPISHVRENTKGGNDHGISVMRYVV